MPVKLAEENFEYIGKRWNGEHFPQFNKFLMYFLYMWFDSLSFDNSTLICRSLLRHGVITFMLMMMRWCWCGWVEPETPLFLLYAITFSVYCILLEFFDFLFYFCCDEKYYLMLIYRTKWKAKERMILESWGWKYYPVAMEKKMKGNTLCDTSCVPVCMFVCMWGGSKWFVKLYLELFREGELFTWRDCIVK